MNKININETFPIYYKTDDLLTNQSVIYDVWGDTGIAYTSNTPATGEIGIHGVYYLDFTSPAVNTYLLCKVGLANKTFQRSIIIQCGDPVVPKVFYVDERFRPGLSISYEIYDLIGGIVQSGDMIDAFNGFYSAGVSGLTNGTYFLKIDPFTCKFSIPIENEFHLGDCVASIETRFIMVNVHSSHGGASKSRHSIFDHEGEMTKRKIHAHLKENYDEASTKGVILNSMKDKDIERPKVKAVLKGSETENMLHPINADLTFGPKKDDETKFKSVNNNDDYVNGTNIINYPIRGGKNA